MNILPVVSIVFGVIIIVGRTPLLFAPEAALKVIHNIIQKKSNLRLIGSSTTLFGVFMIAAVITTNQLYPLTVSLLGYFFAIVGGSLVIFPSSIQKLAVKIWSMSNLVARILGLTSVILGLFLIYIGVTCL